MDNLIQQGRDPEWRLAFEDRLDEAARARVRSAVKNGESVDEANQASIAAGLARREQRRVLLLGLVLLPVQLGVAVFWVRLFVTGRLPTVFGWFWIAVLLMLIGVAPFALRRRHQVASRAAAVNDQIARLR
jgi:MprA protease rhombosortase-interaction domain-containing protein